MIIKHEKYRKVFKPNINKVEYKSTLLKQGFLGLKSESYGIISLSEINAIRLFLKRNLKKNIGSFWIRVFPEQYITKKSLNNSRMGKGKGRLDKMIIIVKKGQIILELSLNKNYNLLNSFIYYKYFNFLLRKCIDKLSIKSRIISMKY